VGKMLTCDRAFACVHTFMMRNASRIYAQCGLSLFSLGNHTVAHWALNFGPRLT